MKKKKSMYELAVEMLEATNPYKKPLKDFHYSYMLLNARENKALLCILRSKLTGKRRSVSSRGALEKDYAVCYKAIADAFDDYFADYKPQSFAFQQETKVKFVRWLNEIARRYGIQEKIIPENLQVKPNESDTAIVMLKELHDRKGKKVSEIAEAMHISPRAVQKNLRKLDPELSNSEEDRNTYVPFRIGGQPVKVKISAMPPESGKGDYYKTSNTVHPLVLLENQMQIGTLLKVLANSYYADESGVCYSIGLDIWYQLSEYSRNRVKEVFAMDDENLQDFIEELEDTVPGSDENKFQTERNMFEQIHGSMSDQELLRYVMKGAGRHCNISLSIEGGKRKLIGYTLDCHRNEGDVAVYRAISPDGVITEFTSDQLISIECES
ncbi:MAG: helix-turn-helix domain-containing protein [Lachnospiraceae bacterium]|nr:helix-turn-helix domain-containing protein [Lachnospiraceae bacterium]